MKQDYTFIRYCIEVCEQQYGGDVNMFMANLDHGERIAK